MEKYFGADGLLAKSLEHFETRPGQLQMAEAVEEVLAGGDGAGVLLAEAETGIGKTLAYLLPAVLSGRKVVVSTATINLQDQILNREIPLLENLLATPIAAVCVKGRQNYLCYYRWFQLRSSSQGTLLDDDSRARIDDWLQLTETGDRAELDWLPDYSPLWPKITAQSHQCLGGDCPEWSHCFINELRRRAGGAVLLIVNHHLFFSDLALRGSGYGEILPRYEGVVFDEAHHLENIASTFFGLRFSEYQVIDLVSDIERQAEADLPPSTGDRIVRSARGLRERTETFFRLFPEPRGRYPLAELQDGSETWYEDVTHLAAALERVAGELEEFIPSGEGWKTLQRRGEELHGNLLAIALPEVLPEQGRMVHWYERRERSVALSATPVSVADKLRELLYPAVDFVILTSATLTTGGNFSYVRERLGVDDEATTLRLPSPFDYGGRTCLYIPEAEFPLPADPGYGNALCRRIYELLQLSAGRALILCTSFRGMEMVADSLQGTLPYPVLVQGSAARNTLLQQFRQDRHSVLVAVASFWEGVDVPGEALSCVIIDKLPFEVPSDPVLQARIADIRAAGGNPFFDLQVPRAVLTLRQGVGRLMRAGDDAGLIAIMDGRLFGKRYGGTFLASLPPSPVVRTLADVELFFHRLSTMGT